MAWGKSASETAERITAMKGLSINGAGGTNTRPLLFRPAGENQCELNVAFELRALNHAEVPRPAAVCPISNRAVTGSQYRVIEQVNKLGSELKVFRFAQRKILLDAQVNILFTGASHAPNSAGSKRTGRRGYIGSAKPLNTGNAGGRGGRAYVGNRSAAIRTLAARASSQKITVFERERESASQRDDGAEIPIAHDGIDHLIHVLAVFPVGTHGELVNRIRGNVVGHVVIARAPFCGGIIDVLKIRRRGHCLTTPRTIVAARIGVSLRVRIGHVVLQPAAETLLQHHLKRVVQHSAV